jgi:type II secretory pathway pseudopilin PulG
MVQFDPNMVAQMLMQPIQRATENLGGGPFGIGADAGGSYFVDPEVAARTGYGTAVTGTSFFPGAGIVDAYGGAVDITGQPLPSFSENIREGQFTDAGLQALGVAGDIATIAAPLTGGATALLGAMMKAPRAAQKVTKATDVASDASKAERQARIAANRREANIARFGYDPNDPETLPDTSYRIQHQARGPNEENPVRLDDLTKSTTGEQAGYPDNFYSSEGQRIYAQGARNANDEYGMANTESYNIIKSVKGNPDAEVTIYRGVPDEESITDINPGDFVTLSKKYAELHAASGYGSRGDEAGKIISKKVKVKDIYWDQNDVNEFGYFPDSDVGSIAKVEPPTETKIDLPTDSSKVNNLDMSVIKAKQVTEGSDTVLEYPNLFHGSTEKGLEFLDIEKSRRTSMGAIPAINATENKQLATAFTRGELGDKPEGEIYNLKGPFKILNLESENGRGLWEDVYGKDPQKALKDGYDGIQFNQVENMRVEAFYKDIDLADIKGAKEIQLFKPKIDILKK